MNFNSDTICAISTKLGDSAINIVRMSGENSLKIMSDILGSDFSKLEARKLYLKKIFDGDELLDQCLVTYFEKGKSYNNELIVEINTHGGIVVASRVLELLLKRGARLATPGEFTKRAFLNGKMSMEEIEAVSGIINAKTNLQHKVSMKQYSGQFSNKINDIKDKIMDLIASVEVNIDYPEYDEAEDITSSFVLDKITSIESDLEKMLQRVKNGKILQEGINTTIIGKPNVGKSSLLNALTNEQSAIVTDIAGTTRDVIVEQIKIKEFLINLIDTAGIRKNASDKVEEIGIQKSKDSLASSDFAIVVLDLSEELDEQDLEILDLVKDHPHIILGNKVDLGIKAKVDFEYLPISAEKMLNIDMLEEKIIEYIFDGKISENEFYYVSSLEKQDLIRKCLQIASEVKENVENGYVLLDFVVVDVTNMYQYLSQVNNSARDGEILDRLFSDYCLGK